MHIYKYYVYAYLRASNNTPYYIGKGFGKRAYSKQHKVSVPKDKTKIVFLETNLSDVGACALERRYIRWYGRKGIDPNGILHNISEGGEGATGVKHSRGCYAAGWNKNKSNISQKGKKFYHNKTSQGMFLPNQQPPGWVLGRLNKVWSFGSTFVWINDGKINKRHNPSMPIPPSFIKGFIKTENFVPRL